MLLISVRFENMKTPHQAGAIFSFQIWINQGTKIHRKGRKRNPEQIAQFEIEDQRQLS